MITIEMPIWFAIIYVVSTFLLIVHLIVAEFFVNLIHKKYDLSMKKKIKSPYRIVDNHYLHYVNDNDQLMVIDLDKLFNYGYTKGEENEKED